MNAKAKAGDGLALHNLGQRYQKGIGVEADSWKAFEYYQQAAATGLALGYKDVGDAILQRDIAEGLMLEGDKLREVAARWYRKVAAQGRTDALDELQRLGLPTKAIEASAPLPICPSEELPGQHVVSGIWLRTTNHSDAYGFLVQAADGHTLDVLMGNNDFPEFMDIREGDTVTLAYTTSRGLDVYSAECVTTLFYVPDSGKILKRTH